MNNSLLKAAYSSDDFRERGHELIDQLADHLDRTIQEKEERVIPWNPPEKELDFWKTFSKQGDENKLFQEVLKHSISVHHPKYIGHQVSLTAPITVLSSMVSAMLNNGMAIYEMGMASNAIERIITDLLCSKIGFDDQSNGFLTSGGTLANLTALLSARKAKAATDVWKEGHTASLGIMVSEEAHYCIERAAKIMGLGEQGIIKVPANSNFAMDVSALETCYQKATASGINVFAIVGSAPSTSTGILDDLDTIAAFSKKNDLWYHVDAAHGGAAIFSPSYAPTLKGISEADSVVIDGHKMMMMPGITTALLYRDSENSYATFSQKADYLLDQTTEQDWYNSGKRTFECTKNMMCLHWFTLLKTYGEGIFDEHVTVLYDLGTLFGKMVQKDPQFELAIQPMSNIVCFRVLKENLNTIAINQLNEKIRKELLEEGKFYIVQTRLRGKHYLRVTIMNPFTTETHLKKLLELVKEKALSLQ